MTTLPGTWLDPFVRVKHCREFKEFLIFSTKITVTDAETISKIESGKQVELSCGYDLDLIEESGSYNGEHYDAIQTNIKYNHVASVKAGRAGAKITQRKFK